MTVSPRIRQALQDLVPSPLKLNAHGPNNVGFVEHGAAPSLTLDHPVEARHQMSRALALPLAALSLSLLPLAAACGGEARHYSWSATRICLEDQGYNTSAPDDFGPLDDYAVRGGAYVTEFSENTHIVLIFAKDAPGAEATEDRFREFTDLVGVPRSQVDAALKRVVRRDGNVTWWWVDEPTKQSEEVVEECLNKGV